MEIIDRPLSEVIKEQNIGKQLRRSSRRGSGNSSNQSGRVSGNNNQHGGNGRRNSNNSRGRDRPLRGGADRRRGGDRQQRGGGDRRRFRDAVADRRRRPFGGARRGGASRDAGPVTARRGRRGGVDMGDSRRGSRDERGVKSFGAARRSRFTAADRNDRQRRRGRDDAVNALRRSRR